MSPNVSTQSLAELSGRRPRLVVGIWIVIFVVAAGIVLSLLGDATTTEFTFTNSPESLRADRLLERIRGPKRVVEVVVVQSEALTVEDARFRQTVERVFGDIMGLGPDKVKAGVHYYQTSNDSIVSTDRHTTIMRFIMASEFDEAVEDAEELLEIVRAANGREGFKVLIAGEASASVEANEVAKNDIRKGEKIGVPAALIILLILFGALLAAIIPLVIAGFAIVVALAATALIGQVLELVFFVEFMIIMIGLAVGIDYSLLIVSRFREELRNGRNTSDAIARTGATASRTVFFSGMTVVVALIGMLVIPTNVYQSLAVGAILVVIAAVLVSLTLLPAVLAILGHRINALRLPVVGRRLDATTRQDGGGFWGWVVRNVMRYPVISLVASAGLLIAAAVPSFDIRTGFSGVGSFPDSMQAKEAFLTLDREFSFGEVSPSETVIAGDIDSDAVQAAMRRLRERLASDQDFVGPTFVERADEGDIAVISARVAGEFSSDQAIDAVARLRDEHIPEAFAGVDAEVLVTGITAFDIDFFAMVARYTPIVFAVVLALSFTLLTLFFRSVVVPLKAILMNLLSVGAAYGLMVLVFQKGVGADLLGFQQEETIQAWIPLFLFSVLFGLSMDYHVFLLSRVRERYDQTGDNNEAVAYGLRATAGLITGAAFIMVAVFIGFALGDLVGNQQVGFGLAVAVFFDATIVRTILVPSAMRLLGNANWYLPSFLNWIPDLRVEQAEAPAPAGSDD